MVLPRWFVCEISRTLLVANREIWYYAGDELAAYPSNVKLFTN